MLDNESLYSQYLRERTSDLILETDTGFATYRYINDGQSVYIIDIYTTPESRKKGYAAVLADVIATEAKEKGCVEMLGTVVPSAKGSTVSLKVLLAYGFSLKTSSADLIVFRKDI